MGTAIIFVLIAAEVFFLIWNIISKKNHSAEKSVANLAEAALFVILSICGVIMMSFRYYGAAVMLAVLTVISVIVLVTKKEREYKLSRSISGHWDTRHRGFSMCASHSTARVPRRHWP